MADDKPRDETQQEQACSDRLCTIAQKPEEEGVGWEVATSTHGRCGLERRITGHAPHPKASPTRVDNFEHLQISPIDSTAKNVAERPAELYAFSSPGTNAETSLQDVGFYARQECIGEKYLGILYHRYEPGIPENANGLHTDLARESLVDPPMRIAGHLRNVILGRRWSPYEAGLFGRECRELNVR